MEDIYVMPKVFDLAGSVAFADSIKYFYRLRSDSIWHKPFDSSKLDYFKSISFVEEYLASKYPDLLKYSHWDCIGNTMYIIRNALKTLPKDDPIVQELAGKIKKRDVWDYMFSKRSMMSKISMVLMAFMPNFTFSLLKFAYRLKRQ